MRNIAESGIISQDGKLMMPMERLRSFFRENKGRRVIARFYTADPGASELQLAYYRSYVVPTIQSALVETGERKTFEQTDEWLREQCPVCVTEDGELMEAEEMTQPEFSDFLDWLKQFAAENLSVYVEDPKTL